MEALEISCIADPSDSSFRRFKGHLEILLVALTLFSGHLRGWVSVLSCKVEDIRYGYLLFMSILPYLGRVFVLY